MEGVLSLESPRGRLGLWRGKEGTVGEAKKSNLPRLITLFIAFVGCVVTVLPLLFSVGANPVPFILVGSGVAVIALALFLFYSI